MADLYAVRFSTEPAKLARQMRSLESALQGKAVGAGLRRAAKPVLDLEKQMVPRRTGALLASLGMRQLSKRARARLGLPRTSLAMLVGSTRKGHGAYRGRRAVFQEYGTKRMRAHPFLGPALSRAEPTLSGNFYFGMAAYLNRKAKV